MKQKVFVIVFEGLSFGEKMRNSRQNIKASVLSFPSKFYVPYQHNSPTKIKISFPKFLTPLRDRWMVHVPYLYSL